MDSGVDVSFQRSATLRPMSRDYALWYLLLLLGFVSYQALTWPIIAVDTDLWYHLNAGRFIAQNGALPQNAFFSFLEPSPPWLDYYWLSQVLFHAGHALAGYTGLVVLRAAVLLATLGLILALLRSGRGREGLAFSAFVFTLVALFLIPRFNALRPHDLSYLMIAGCLLLLETRRHLWLLPIASLLWVNLHGVEYPVLLLIVGSYLGAWLLDRMRGTQLEGQVGNRDFAFAALAIGCVLLTPHGLSLIGAPFTDTEFASRYIQELRPTQIGSLVSFELHGLLLSRESLLSAILALSLVAAARSLVVGPLRASHLVLYGGAIVLLLRMQRFSSEFVLLSLPLLASLPPVSLPTARWPRALGVAVVALLALLPFRYLSGFFDTGCAFPLCSRALPTGVVAFLNRVGATGNVLHHPNDGGYLQWELFPRHKLYVDLQTPFLFPDTAVFAADQAFHDPVVLRDTLARYRPAFIVTPGRFVHFGSLIARFPDYAPVFVDDEAVLFADAGARPDLVERFGLRAVEPFRLDVRSGEDPAQRARALEELRRINQIHPGAIRTALFEGALALQSGDVQTALARGDAVIGLQPERAEGHRLRGDALLRAERTREAIDSFEAALRHLGSESAAVERQRAHVSRQLYAGYRQLGEAKPAYRALQNAIPDVYAPGIGFGDLYLLGSAAQDAGSTSEARTLLQFALLKTPSEASEMRARIRAALAELQTR